LPESQVALLSRTPTACTSVTREFTRTPGGRCRLTLLQFEST